MIINIIAGTETWWSCVPIMTDVKKDSPVISTASEHRVNNLPVEYVISDNIRSLLAVCAIFSNKPN